MNPTPLKQHIKKCDKKLADLNVKFNSTANTMEKKSIAKEISELSNYANGLSDAAELLGLSLIDQD